jgi:hypothetical protein
MASAVCGRTPSCLLLALSERTVTLPPAGFEGTADLTYRSWTAQQGQRTKVLNGSCVTNTSLEKEVWSCTGDEGRPLEAGIQVQVSNHRKLLSLRAMVVSVAAKVGTTSRLVRSGEASESKPSMTCRKGSDDVETGGGPISRDKLGGCPDDCPGGIRHVGGAKPDQALVRNVRTCRPDAKGKVQVAKTARVKVLMRGTGAEEPVVGLKVL